MMMYVLEGPVAEMIARSLLHFLWQGTLVWLLAALLWKAGPFRHRYASACGLMLLMVLAPVAREPLLEPGSQREQHASHERNLLARRGHRIVELGAGTDKDEEFMGGFAVVGGGKATGILSAKDTASERKFVYIIYIFFLGREEGGGD